MDGSDTSSTLTSLSSDELGEHNIWNPMLGLLRHAHVGVSMEALLDDKDLGRIALSCHFALDVLCDEAEVHCLEGNSMWRHCPR